MEETQLTATPESNDPKGCVNCGHHTIVEGYPTPLCSECRERLIKFPVPMGIKLFGAAVLLVMVFSLFTFPKNLSLGMHLERGKQYEQKHRYKAAQQEFAEVVKKVPGNVEAEGNLMIAAFYNMDFPTFADGAAHLQGVNIEDRDLLNRLNDLSDRLGEFYPDDSLTAWRRQYNDGVPDSAYQSYLTRNPRNVYGLLSYASSLYDHQNFTTCDSVLQVILGIDIEYLPALRILASSKREQEQYDSAYKYCDRILRINQDAGYALAIKARTCLKQKKNAQALELATKSVDIDKKDGYNYATLALAYHFNNMQAKRDALIQQIKAGKDSSMIGYMQYAIDVIEQKEKFRN